jgi:hypothetical protein
MAIQQTAVTTSGATILTSPSSGSYANVGLIFCNYSTSAVTLDVYVVTDGGSHADEHSIFRDISIPAKDSFVLNVEKLLIGTTDKVVAVASANSAVVATATYMPI